MPTDTVEPTTNETTPASEGDLQGKGGTLEFDAAASIADAFAKLQNGDPAPGIGHPNDPVGEKGEEGEAGDPSDEEESDDSSDEEESDDSSDDDSSDEEESEGEVNPSAEDVSDLRNASASAGKAFAAMRKELKAERARAEALQEKLNQITESSAAPEEIDRLKKINEEYERELQVARVEATQEYKDAVISPMMQFRGDVELLSKKYEISSRDILEALSETDAEARSDKLSDVAAGMNDRDKFSLYELEKNYVRIAQSRERIVSNAKLALEKIQEHREKQARFKQEESQKNYKRTFESIWKTTQENLPLLNYVEGDDQWNATIDSIIKTASEPNFESLDTAERARVAIRSAAAPLLASQFVSLFNKYKELEKSLSKYQNATPKAGSGKSVAVQQNKEEFDDFMSALKANLK